MIGLLSEQAQYSELVVIPKELRDKEAISTLLNPIFPLSEQPNTSLYTIIISQPLLHINLVLSFIQLQFTESLYVDFFYNVC